MIYGNGVWTKQSRQSKAMQSLQLQDKNNKLAINHKYEGHMSAPGHDGLEDAGEGCDPDAGGHEDRVLAAEDGAGGGAVRARDVDSQGACRVI